MILTSLARSASVDEVLAFLRLPVDGRLPARLAQQRLRPVRRFLSQASLAYD